MPTMAKTFFARKRLGGAAAGGVVDLVVVGHEAVMYDWIVFTRRKRVLRDAVVVGGRARSHRGVAVVV